MIPDIIIDTGVNTSIFVNKIDYYISLVIRTYYGLNDAIGPNVLNINLVYLLLA